MIELPSNVEAEVAVLGGILLHGGLDEAAAYVSADDFTVDAHRVVWEACQTLAGRYEPVATDTVTGFLAAQDTLDHVGGAVGLFDLSERGCVQGAVGYHARLVADTARRRRVVEASRRLAQHAASQADGLDVAIDSAMEQMTSSDNRSGIISRADLEEAVIRRVGEGGDPGVSTGWDVVDQLYRPPRGMVTVVTGVPGHGKSTFVDALTVNLARLHGWRMAMFSPEQAPPEKHALNLIQTASGKPGDELGERLQDGMDWVLDHFTLLDDQHDNTVGGVLSRARLVAARGQLDGLVVDPWNKLAHDRGRHHRDDLYIQDALHRITRFARQTGVHVWVVAHPIKMQRETPSSSRWQVPSVYDISGGSEWNNQADAIVSVWRDQDGEGEDPATTYVTVQKVRDQGVWGRIGACRLQFAEGRRQYARFTTLREVG